MVRLFILIIIGVIAIAVAYFFFKSVPMFSKMAVVIGGFLAALIGVLLQPVQPLYMALLALLAAALLAALVWVKRIEKQREEQAMIVEQKRESRKQPVYPDATPIDEAPERPAEVEQNEPPKFAGMESIDPDEKER